MTFISKRVLGLILCSCLVLTSLEGSSAMTVPAPAGSSIKGRPTLGRLSEQAAVQPLVEAFHTFSSVQSVAMARRAKRARFLSPWEGEVVPLRFHSDAERTWGEIQNEVESTPIRQLIRDGLDLGDGVDSQQTLREIRARWLKDPTWKWLEIDLLMNKWVRLKAVRQAGAGVCVTGLSLTQARLIHLRPEMLQNLLPGDPFPVHMTFERHPEASSYALARVGDDLVIRPEGDFPPPDERVLTFVSAPEQREKALRPYREAVDRANAAVQLAVSSLTAAQTLSRLPSGSPAVRREKARLAEARAALNQAQKAFHEKEADGLRRSAPATRRSSAKKILYFTGGTAFVLGLVWSGWWPLAMMVLATAVPAFWMAAGDSFRTHIIPRSVIEKLNEKKYDRASDLMARLCNLLALKDPAGSAFITRQMQLKPGAFIAENGVLEYGFLKLNPESVFEIVYSEGSDFSSASVYLLNRWAAAHAGERVSQTPQELAKSYRQSLGVVLAVLQRYRIIPGNAIFTHVMRTKPSQHSDRRPAVQKGPALSATVLKEMRYNGLMSLEEIAWLSKEDLVRQLNRLPEFGELAAQEIKKAGHPMADTSIFDRFEVGRIPGLPLGLLVILIKEKLTELKALDRWLQRSEAELLATLEPHREKMGRQNTRLMLKRIRGAYADYRPSGPGSLFPWWRFYTKWLAPVVEMGVPLGFVWAFDRPGEATLQHAVLYGGWTMLTVVFAHLASYSIYAHKHPFHYRRLGLKIPPALRPIVHVALGIGTSVAATLIGGGLAIPVIAFYLWRHVQKDWRYLRRRQDSSEPPAAVEVPPVRTMPLPEQRPEPLPEVAPVPLSEMDPAPGITAAVTYFRSLRPDQPVYFMSSEWVPHLERLLLPDISMIQVEWVSPPKALGGLVRRAPKVIICRVGKGGALTWNFVIYSDVEIVMSKTATWKDLEEAIMNSSFFHSEFLRMSDASSAEFRAAQRALLKSA